MKSSLYEFINAQKSIKVSKEIKDMLKSCCDRVLETEGFNMPAEVCITFTDNENIKKLNSEQRDISKVTDVLSFPLNDFERPGDFRDIKPDETGRIALGDIVISLEKAKEQAFDYGHSFEREVAFLCVHSMLHLLGYDHMTPADEVIMCEKQEEVLNSLGIKRQKD